MADKTGKIADHLVRLIDIFQIMRNRQTAREGEHRPFDPHYMVLCFLAHGGLPMSEIGRRLHRSRPNMTAIIDRLMGEGKVKREHDAEDRRVVNIVITGKGRRHLEERRKTIRENIKRNISGLSIRDQGILCDSLENVTRIAGRMSRD